MNHHTSDTSAVKNNRRSRHETREPKGLLARYADDAEVKRIFGDDRNLEFGDTCESVWPEEELECEREARNEWEPAPDDPVEVYIFKGTCRDIGDRLFEPERTVVIHGYKNAADPVGPDEFEETPSLIQEEARDADEEPKGERDQTTATEDGYLPSKWLRNAYAMLVWSYALLDADAREEFKWRYARLRRRLLLRAHEIGLKLRKNDFCSNRDYLLDYEERELFETKFRDEAPEPRTKFSAAKPRLRAEKVEVSEITARLLSLLK